MPRLNEDMVTAAKAKDKIRLSAIRMLKTALHNKEIDLMRPLNETETMQILSALVKQRKDSIEQFAKGGRMDLVEKEEAELKILQEFMPAQMSDEDVEALIQKSDCRCRRCFRQGYGQSDESADAADYRQGGWKSRRRKSESAFVSIKA